MSARAAKEKIDAVIKMPAMVLQSLPGGLFRVELNCGRQVLARMVGKMRRGFVRLAPGDCVHLELSAFNLEQARILGLLSAEQ